jgi:hypothetical protein
MIIWIASYPKSGNTWVRALLSSYLYYRKKNFDFNDLNKIEQFPSKKHLNSFLTDFGNIENTPQYWISAQKKINTKDQFKFLKTHNALCTINGYNFTDKDNTLAAIYIVREPRNIITSLANHYDISIDHAYNFLTNKRKIIFSKEVSKSGALLEEKGNAHFVGSWNEHYNSWKKIGFAPIKIVKYEDLIADTEKTFLSILKFLSSFMSIKIEKGRVDRAVKSCTFDELKKKESREGFFEAPAIKKSNKKIVFFKLGKNNNWKKILKPEMDKKIKNSFFEEMFELGYLKKN